MGFKIKKTVNGETVWEPIKAKKYTASKITEYTGALPITITTDGNSLLDYRIYGNTVQTGTPTPENPIMPIGCGELETTGAHAGQYKLPILSNSTVTNIYLGEVETTRRIKRLVLTGEEDWKRAQNQRCYYINASTGCPTDYLKQRITTSICSHYQSQNNTASGSNEVEVGHFCFYTGGGFELYISETTISSAADFKSYLQQQYAAGTPVTVWYVLAKPETGIVNEPLMKIGDYADTVSMEQASVNIPTNNGSTVIDYDGTPKPSQMYTEYNSWSGWSDIDDYKMVNEDWTQEMT